jgi:hypothetical protein
VTQSVFSNNSASATGLRYALFNEVSRLRDEYTPKPTDANRIFEVSTLRKGAGCRRRNDGEDGARTRILLAFAATSCR